MDLVAGRKAMSAKIRKFGEHDVDGLCRLWGEFARMREGLTHSKILNEDAADYFFAYATGLLQRKDTLTLVAEDDAGQLVGYLIANKQRRPPIYRHTKVAYLSDAYVTEAHRGHGVLRGFMAELQKWSRSEGITAIDVQLFQENKDAQEIYRALGFHDYRIVLRQEVGAVTAVTATPPPKA